MAKKSSNPAEAQRKAARARELKKNKEARQKVRETQTVKRDTRELESEIKHLKTQNDTASKTRLAELQKEVDYINRLKAQFVADNPEAHDKVYHVRQRPEGDTGGGSGGQEEASGSGSGAGRGPGHLYDERGRLRDPKRSVYYDPVYNPFGAPPPGMPYRERTPVEESEEEDDSDDSDDEIIMPEGPPPAAGSDSDADTDSSDDIPLPAGPPPPRTLPAPLPPSGPPRPVNGVGFFQPPGQQGFRPRPFFGGPGMVRPGMGLGPGFGQGPGQGVGGSGMAVPMGGVPGSFRPPRPFPGVQAHARPVPPAGVQDPLSDKPTKTFQGHRMVGADLPARPPSASTPAAGGPAGAIGAGEITAAPVMRDLRKESTAFVPRGVKRRKPTAGGSAAGLVGGRVNAAPGAGDIDEDGDERKRKGEGGGGLMGKLGGILGTGAGPGVGGGVGGGMGGAGKKEGGGADDDYQKFLDGLGDLA